MVLGDDLSTPPDNIGPRSTPNYDALAAAAVHTLSDGTTVFAGQRDDPFFVDRKLYPNVDFYSGIIFRAIGIPTSMFTVLFAVARTVGWIAQWKEMIEDPSQKIGRPRQLYSGQTEREYVPISRRK